MEANMKMVLAAVLSAMFLPTSMVVAQTQLPAACGAAATNFVVSASDDNAQPVSPGKNATKPEPGKALVYFIKDDGPYGDHQHFTLRMGMDGAWVGAFKQNAYLMAQVAAGEHHVCVNVQSSAAVGKQVALAHFVAEAGKTYYFRARYL